MPESFADQTDESLAREASSGVLGAFDELVRRYQHRVYGFLLQLVSNPADAREVTQDAFVRAFSALHQFRPGARFSPWLFAIARNKAIDHLRSRKSVADPQRPEDLDYDDPSELLVRREDQSQIWQRARQLLPDLQFQAVWLRYVEDMDVAQIAAVLGKSRTHVKVVLFRARRILANGWQAPSTAPIGDTVSYHAQPGAIMKSNAKPFCSSRRESAPTI
jgi:RNA polymerase sigma-70 factor, ECF subfamily